MKKLAVVTGASSGIGLSFANILASKGYNLIIVARDTKALDMLAHKLKSEHNTDVQVISADLSIEGSANALWSKIESQNIDVLVNNAGFGDLTDVVDADPSKLESMIALNITALTRLSQMAAISMKKRGAGSIVNLASVLSFFPSPHGAVYGATKAYVLSFSEALSEELRGTGVYVTALCPGATKTNFATQANMEHTDIMKGKLPTGDDVARYGYEAMLKHKVVAVHGLRTNVIAHVATRLLPRGILSRISGNLQSPKK